MIKDLPPPTEAEEYRNTAESCETWLLKRGSTGHATNSLIMPIISIGWPVLQSTDLKLRRNGLATGQFELTLMLG